MRMLKRLVCSLLALLPFPAIAFSADARLNELAGEEAHDVGMVSNWLRRKSLLFPPFERATLREDAFKRFERSSALHDEETRKAFDLLIDDMIEEGHIESRERYILSHVPSHRA